MSHDAVKESSSDAEKFIFQAICPAPSAKHIHKLMEQSLQREGEDRHLQWPQPSLWFQIKGNVCPD